MPRPALLLSTEAAEAILAGALAATRAGSLGEYLRQRRQATRWFVRRHLQPVQQSGPRRTGAERQAIGEQHDGDRRWQGESGPRRQRPGKPGACQPDGHADLARGRPGQRLAQRHQIGVGGLAEPFPPLDELGAEIA